MKKSKVCVGIVVFLLFLFAILVLVGSIWLIDYEVAANVVVDSASAEGYGTFQSNTNEGDVAVYYSLRAWNLTNPQEVTFKHAKPELELLGPYVYREYMYKHDVVFLNDGEEVQYLQQKYYVFDTEQSCKTCAREDTFVTGNVALMGMFANPLLRETETAQVNAKTLTKAMVCSVQEESPTHVHLTPFQVMSVEGLFFGYDNDPVLEGLSNLLAHLRQPAIGTRFPGVANKNYSSYEDTLRRGNINVQHTGKNDLSRINEFRLWQNQTEVYFCPVQPPSDNSSEIPTCDLFQANWTQSEALDHGYNKVWGTAAAGSVHATDFLQIEPSLSEMYDTTFVDSIYRKTVMVNKDELTVSDKKIHHLTAKRYTVKQSQWDNTTLEPSNAGYYQFGPSGVFNLTGVSGFPMFGSKPHFLDADPAFQRAVTGMNAKRSKHDTIIDIVPVLGTAIRAQKSIQINLFLEDWELGAGPTSNTSELCLVLKGVEGMHCCTQDQEQAWDGHWDLYNQSYYAGLYLPAGYVEEAFTINEALADKIKLLDTMQVVLFYSEIAVAVFIVIALIAAIIFNCKENNATENTSTEEDAEEAYPGYQQLINP